MSFAVAADAYDRFMGRYSTPLAPAFADYAGVAPGQRVLDVGCGPGALTSVLAGRVGPSAVTAVDPSESFVAALEERQPGVEVRRAKAEELPFADASFDAVLAQLVVHFMDDPLAGIVEMARVGRAGATVAACVWDHAGAHGPLSAFWNVAREVDPDVEDGSGLAGTSAGELAELLAEAGLRSVEDTVLSVEVAHPTFDDWWAPYTLGVGPGGAYVASLGGDERERLRARCAERLQAPFTLSARAWAARGHV